MPVKVEYKASVAGDLARLDAGAARRVVAKIDAALAESGRGGQPLAGEFAGLFKIRVGDYRVIYTITRRGYLVLRIGHRRDVYRKGRPRPG